MSRGLIIGIDLGTTNSLVGALQAGKPILFPNEVGELLTPSAVGLDDDGSLLVGASAKARMTTHPGLTATCFKRDMGTSRLVPLGRRRERPEALSAAVLSTLKANAEAVLGYPVEEAVVTVPAYFGDLQRQATRDAGTIAGLKVERIVNEPTAAALAYGLHHLDDEIRAVVLDLGGGTFDVTVLEIAEGVIEVQASAGDVRLGGLDFDDALVAYAEKRIHKALGKSVGKRPQAAARLRDACEGIKRRLSDEDRARLVLPRFELDDGREHDVEIELSRDEVEGVWVPVMERLRGPVGRALADAEAKGSSIDEVLLVGGSTRMPCVVREFSRLFGRLPRRDLPPDEAVALGAAIQGGLKSGDEAVDDLVVTDVAPFTLGIETASEFANRTVGGVFSPVLERGTVIPASRVEVFVPVEAKQRQIELAIYQGEHATCDANTLLGKLLLPLPKGKNLIEKQVDVRFTYDLNGLLEVEAIVRSTKERRHVVIQQRPGTLTPGELEAARVAMQRLKFHPREALPNRTALARADALFQELTRERRRRLGDAIAWFRSELDGQDPERIATARERLTALISELG